MRNQSEDLPFRWSLNPTGAARTPAPTATPGPSTSTDLGAGSDFERKIRIKPQAARLLTETFERPSWVGEGIALWARPTPTSRWSAQAHPLGPRCLRALPQPRRHPHPVAPGHPRHRPPPGARAHDAVRVHVSIPILDPDLQAAGAAPAWASARRHRRAPRRRVPVGVSVSPVIPGLNDVTIPATPGPRGGRRGLGVAHPCSAAPAVEAVFRRRLHEALLRPSASWQGSRGWGEGRSMAARRASGCADRERPGRRPRACSTSMRPASASAPAAAADPQPFRRPGRGQQVLVRGG